MLRVRGSIALLSLIAIAGCTSGNKLVGTWVNQTDEFTQTLKADGTFETQYPLNANTMHLYGTYEYSGTTLIITPSKYKVDGPPLPDQLLKSFDRKMGKPTQSEVLWEDNNTFILKLDSGGMVTMKRKQ